MPKHGFIMLIETMMHREQPACAPDDEAKTVEEVCDPFIFDTAEEAQARIDDMVSEKKAMAEEYPEDYDEDFSAEDDVDDFFVPCILHENGIIEFDGAQHDMTWVYEPYGLEIPDHIREQVTLLAPALPAP